MRHLSFAMALLCGGCPAPLHALSIEVRSGGRPVSGAVVALVCRPAGSALLTDEAGRASFKVRDEQRLEACRLLAGKPGFRTVESQPVRQCGGSEGSADCPEVALELVELGGAAAPESSSPLQSSPAGAP